MNDIILTGPSTVRASWGLRFAIACVALVALTGCSGGQGSTSGSAAGCNATQQTGGVPSLCLVACSLGCTQVGCSITDIAQNQPIILVFNQNIDPRTVNSATFQLRTAAGGEPVGQFITTGTTVTFIPDVQVVGGASFFGFEANQTYTLTLPGGPNQINALRGVDGSFLPDNVVCNLIVSRGVVDLDGKPPTAELVSPTRMFDVDPRTSIALEFSEIIDVTPFLQAPAGSEPVRVFVLKAEDNNGVLTCRSSANPPQVRGTWTITNDVVRQVSTATFNSSQQIPRGVCMTIVVDTSVRDLSGVPSLGQTFHYFTTAGLTPPIINLEEDFTTDDFFDPSASSGDRWIGGPSPGQLGWDGLHGEFDALLGTPIGPGVFLWNTDSQLIPKSLTLSGKDEMVTDGVFRFSKFVLPSGLQVRFAGQNPAQIYVRGTMQIDGAIVLNGQSLPEHSGVSLLGQAGGSAGAGGGVGGRGADAGDGVANRPNFNGQDGEHLHLPAGQPAQIGGGSGALQFPLDGSNNSVTLGFSGIFSIQVAAGGGGGGYVSPGANGIALKTEDPENPGNRPQDLGPDAPGGAAFPLFPPPPATSVLDHFLIGGSGGGGGASHPFLWSLFQPNWRSGGGGGGGGGALAARVGNDLVMTLNGRVSAVGGSTTASENNFFSVPGGGGSGGSVILQISDSIFPGGKLDVSGGDGGTVLGGFTNMCSEGGDGSSGYLRIETPGPVPADPTMWTGNALPAPTAQSVGALQETDDVTGVQSNWYRTGQVFPPDFDRYEVVASFDGGATTMVFSDDPNVGPMATGAIRFLVQGAKEDQNGQVDPASITPWRKYVGPFAPTSGLALTEDGATAFRFLLLFDRTLASQIQVQKVTVVFRPL